MRTSESDQRLAGLVFWAMVAFAMAFATWRVW
jgi:hypothetical protein